MVSERYIYVLKLPQRGVELKQNKLKKFVRCTLIAHGVEDAAMTLNLHCTRSYIVHIRRCAKVKVHHRCRLPHSPGPGMFKNLKRKEGGTYVTQVTAAKVKSN